MESGTLICDCFIQATPHWHRTVRLHQISLLVRAVTRLGREEQISKEVYLALQLLIGLGLAQVNFMAINFSVPIIK